MTLEEQKKQIADELWLNYYNDILHEKGIINESVRNKMKWLINNRAQSKKTISRKKAGLDR